MPIFVDPERKPKKKKSTNLTVIPKQEGNVSVMPNKNLSERIADLNEEYAVVLMGNQVLIMRHWIRPDGEDCFAYYDKGSLDTWLLSQPFISEDGKTKNMAKLWLSSPHRREFQQVYFRPINRDEQDTKEGRYNIWRDFSYDAKENQEKIQRYLDHIKENICSNDSYLYEWVLSFMADIVQKPWRKIGVALVLRGEVGIGKGVFAGHLGKLFGTHFSTITQIDQLVGRFNQHLINKVLIFADELSWDLDRKGAGVFRAQVTEPLTTVEGKGKDAVTMESHIHFIIASNSDWVVPAGIKERRFAILDVGEARMNDRAYFDKIKMDMESGGYEALLHFLKNYAYDDIFLYNIPKTDALLQNKSANMEPHVKWWLQCLINEEIGQERINETDHIKIETKQLYKSYLDFCQSQREMPLSDNELPKSLRRFVTLEKFRQGSKDLRTNIYVIPPIQQLRDQFDNMLGQKYNWPTEVDIYL